MKQKHLGLICISILFLVSACVTQVQKNGPVCSSPYLLVGTECCLDKNNNSICDTDEKTSKEKELTSSTITGQAIAQADGPFQMQKPKNDSEPKSKKLSYIDQKNLINAIKEVMDSDYYQFEQDKSHPDYIRSSRLKYYVIHTIPAEDKHIKNAKEFCDAYCAQNWDGWRYYFNMSSFRALHPILPRENFSNDAEYRDYKQHAGYVLFKITETPYKVDNGEVLEYQLILWQQNLFGTFEGAYDDTLLVYKVPCAPNATVLLRPKWDSIKVSFPVASIEEVQKTWDNQIIPLRKELLEKANEMLSKCPLQKQFFKGYSFPDYSKSEMLSVHWRTYYKYYLNITSSISAGVVPSTEESKHVLKQINVSFVNDDEFDLYDLGLKVTVIADDNDPIDYYNKEFEGVYRSGRTILNKSLSLRDIHFSSNLTIDANLYTIEDKGEVRPLRVFFSKEDFKQ